jgi:hypothetical protein
MTGQTAELLVDRLILRVARRSGRDLPTALMLRRLKQQPSSHWNEESADRLDQFERYRILDELQKRHSTRCNDSYPFLISEEDSLYRLKRQLLVLQTDWNEVMLYSNCIMDRFVAAFRESDYRVRDKKLEQADDLLRCEAERWQAKMNRSLAADAEKVTDLRYILLADLTTLTKLASFRHLRSLRIYSISMTRCLAERRILHLGFRLLLDHQQSSEFPEHLATVLNSKAAPPINRDVLIDPFTDRPLKYRRTSDGFQISSTGQNLTDETEVSGGQSDDVVLHWP